MTADRALSVAVLTNSPTPYRIPFFNELARHCRLLVIVDAMREPGREWELDPSEFEFQCVATRELPLSGRVVRWRDNDRWVPHVPLDLVPVLNRFEPDVVVSLEFGVRSASAALFCRLKQRPLIIWWEGTPHTEHLRRPSKLVVRKALAPRATRAWANGGESAEVLTSYGVPESRVDLGMTGIDTNRWAGAVDDMQGAPNAALREKLGVRGLVLLFVGGLNHRKGVRELLSALTLVAGDDLPPWSVLFVGSGPLAPEIEAWARRHPAIPVALTGFVQPAELPGYYAAADLFVMPSLEDVWGMVCLEALVAGLPQVTSSLAGAASTLITAHEIGAIVDPRDVPRLAEHLAERIRLGPRQVPQALRDDAIAQWSPSALAERAMSSIRSATCDPS